ncbi:MAG: HEAT repeat domain-containing protein [Deltaproteobacteria bacterium]|nr:HEAT repeat domain-containing protein [Deltaproteobacteria bacterium]
MGNRELKARIGQLLRQDDFQNALETIRSIPGRQAVNPLFSLFYSGDEAIRWRAVTAMGAVVGHMADSAMESARVVMRRLMWNLNDESGGIGWGSPEAMGEITAVHAGLAGEFASILISYINPDGNFLEHELLQRGSLWGVGRLAHARPLLAKPATPFLTAFFDSPDPYLRGTAIWAAAPILNDTMRPLIRTRLSDTAPLRLYRQMQIMETTVGNLAKAALANNAL